MAIIRTLQIGNVTLENNLILAPMAGVSDLPFRLLCREQGAGLVCMEMVSAKAILYKNRNTEELLTIESKRAPGIAAAFRLAIRILSVRLRSRLRSGRLTFWI